MVEERYVRFIRPDIINNIVNNQQSNSTPKLQQPSCGPQLKKLDFKRSFSATMIVLLYTLAIGCIGLGSVYLNECPGQKMLPIGHIIFGVILLLARLLNCVYDYRYVFIGEMLRRGTWNKSLNILLCIVQLGMFIAVLYWTHGGMDPLTHPELCDITLYNISHIGSLVLIFIGSAPILIFCWLSLCISKEENNEANPPNINVINL